MTIFDSYFLNDFDNGCVSVDDIINGVEVALERCQADLDNVDVEGGLDDLDVDVEGDDIDNVDVEGGQADLDVEGGEADLENVDVEGGDQRVFCLRPVGDDLFRQVL